MKRIFIALLLTTGSLARAQELPEYNYSATAWNSKSRVSVPLAPEETVRKDKMNSAYKVPYGALFSKKPAVKTTMQLSGAKSKARIAADDTLKLFVKIDKDTDPRSVIKIYRTSVVNNNREISVMQVSKKGEVERSDGDYTYDLKKLSPGVFHLDIVGARTGDEIFVYIGTHETAMAKLSLGID